MEIAVLMLAQTGAGSLGTLLFPLIIIAIFWFILIVPQRRQLKEHQALVAGLEKGDQVVTAGGVIGEITAVKDDSVQIRSGTSTLVVERNRVVKRVVPPGETPAPAKK